jgi:hypothetical protein
MTYVKIGDHKCTDETVSRALDHHQDTRLIRGWVCIDGVRIITLAGGEVLRLHTLRDAALLVHGLGSADHAIRSGKANITSGK